MRRPFLYWYVAAAALLVVAGGIWWNKVSTDPHHVFWGMVHQSLSTQAVTIQASQQANGTSVKQTVQYSLGATNMSHAITTLSQPGTSVTDEMIGTPAADFTRYVDINTTQQSQSGKPLDFSKVLGVWAKSDTTTAARSGGTAVLLSQAVLGTGLPLGGVAVPIANLSPDLRAKLEGQIRGQNVYQVNFATVKKSQQHGREVYTYDVTLQPILYASMLKRYAQYVGMHNLDQLDVNSFAGQQSLALQLTVDVRSHHLVSARAGNSAGSTTQTYTSYDVPVRVSLPKNAVSATELQTRLSNLQK